jgi:hypothetical protein
VSTPNRGSALGSHTEFKLRVGDLRVMGIVDLLVVEPDGARIVDFKTGAHSPPHAEQVKLYALLWRSDLEANPDGLPPTSLVLSYPEGDESVPVPAPDEMAALSLDTARRVADADNTLAAGGVPQASPGEQCPRCSVRGLCDTYWATQVPPPESVDNGEWFDLEGVLGAEHAARSRWLTATCGTRVLLRTPNAALPEHADGQRVRLLGVRQDHDVEEGTVIALLATSTEVLALTMPE